MPERAQPIPNRRAIIDRRVLAGRLEGTERADFAALLKGALTDGRAEIARRLEARPYAGSEIAAAYAFLTDQVLRLGYDYVTTQLFPNPNPSASERLLLLAVGGYGRGEMALNSDVDIALVTPDKPVAWTEQVIEALLYLLWDLGLKVGHSSRSLPETIRAAAGDQTVRTALLEMRYLWGDEALFDEVSTRFWGEVVAGTAQAFVADKLEERNARHLRMGDSRYVVEPNVKEGKGGLRDLHTLFWIGKYAYRVRSVPELVEAGLLRPGELRQFQKAERYFHGIHPSARSGHIFEPGWKYSKQRKRNSKCRRIDNHPQD